MTTTESVPDYPMTRAAGCPFDPPPQLTRLQQEAPLVKVAVFGKPVWMVTRYDDQRQLLPDQRISADVFRPDFPGTTRDPLPESERGSVGFIVMDDPEHARLRRLVSAPFAIKRVEAMRPRIQGIVDRLIDQLLDGPRPVDLVTAFALPTASQVICELLGVPYEDRDAFDRAGSQLANVGLPMEDRIQARIGIGKYLDKLVGDKLADPGDDLLSGVAEQVRAGRLTRWDAAGIGVLLLSAGHETTSNMIALGTLALLEHPGQLELLRDSDDPAVVAGAVEELLRYLTINHHSRRRQVIEDFEYGGRLLKAGDGILFPSDIANRDPSVFAEPDRLDLTRDASRHITFGVGPHACLGQPLARVELQVVFGTLYRRIPTLRSAVPMDHIGFKQDSALYGVHSLPVTW
ncbi:cytochrome P450 [Kribbella sp. NPDC056345]|uniref:cytochrome P450 n=1 Tax=Kribbella sp. NPDC056345 TaxID=3345789 RepID=UPI0035D927F4